MNWNHMEPQATRLAAIEERLDLLKSVAGAVIGSQPLEEALSQHAHQVCQALGADFCIIRRLMGDQVVLLASYGVAAATLEPAQPADLGIGKVLIQTRKPIGVKDAVSHPHASPYLQKPRRVDFVSYAGTPLINRDDVIGIMGVYYTSKLRNFAQDELDLLQALGNNIAVCIRNYELYEELQAVNSDLDIRVQSRTNELEMANKEMEQFTYTIAHDLRAPVRAIVTNAQMILEDYGSVIPEGAKELLERQAASTKRLSNMMDGLLALTRIGKHEVHIMQMNLSRLAEEVAMDMIRANPDMPPGFDIEPNILIAADTRLMRILLQNLYENSIKFAQQDTRPIVKVRTDPKDASISFVVEDNGIGFNIEYVGKIFQPFERLVRDEYPGTGIGLASVKKIVDKHRGHIQVRSTPGKGTAFEFRL